MPNIEPKCSRYEKDTSAQVHHQQKHVKDEQWQPPKASIARQENVKSNKDKDHKNTELRQTSN